MSVLEAGIYAAVFVICVCISAYFSSAEIAFMSLQRIRLEHLVTSRVHGASRVARLLQEPAKLLSVILLGSNLVNTLATAAITILIVARLGERQGLVVATIVTTVVLLVFADATPKTVAAHKSEQISLKLAPSLEVTSRILTPFVLVLSWIASKLSRMMGAVPVPRSLATEEEIRTMITVGQREGTVEKDKAEMLANIFEFTDRPAREVMVPRSDVIWVEKGTTLADFLKLYVENPLSRFPVYEGNRDNVIGIISIKDVLMALAKGSMSNQDALDDLIRPPYFAPETKHINKLFAEMQTKNYHLAVIVDEYGGTVGVVSQALLLERIVGPLGEELAGIEKDYEVVGENTYQIDGSMRISEANEKIGLQLPEGDYETVAGFLLSRLGHVPSTNEILRYKGLKIAIIQMRGLKIDKVLVTREV